MKNNQLNLFANKLVNAFLRNKTIAPLPLKYTKKIANAQKLRKLCEKKTKHCNRRAVLCTRFVRFYCFFACRLDDIHFLENRIYL